VTEDVCERTGPAELQADRGGVCHAEHVRGGDAVVGLDRLTCECADLLVDGVALNREVDGGAAVTGLALDPPVEACRMMLLVTSAVKAPFPRAST
jgi:hypothetical protein